MSRRPPPARRRKAALPAMGLNPTATQWDCREARPRRPMPPRTSEKRIKTVNMSVVNDNEATSLAGTRLGLLVRKALQIREAAAHFERDWPPLASRPSMPVFAWTELERQ